MAARPKTAALSGCSSAPPLSGASGPSVEQHEASGSGRSDAVNPPVASLEACRRTSRQLTSSRVLGNGMRRRCQSCYHNNMTERQLSPTG